MAKCKNCLNLGDLYNEDNEIICKWCHKIWDSPDIIRERDCKHFEPQTNADAIRNMTDEELADFLVKVNTAYAEPCMVSGGDCKHENTDKDCKDCFLEWLQAEAKGDSEC